MNIYLRKIKTLNLKLKNLKKNKYGCYTELYHFNNME